MQPLTHFTNKSLLRIGGFPICSIIINKLKFGGIDAKDIAIACHKKNYYDYAWEFRDIDVGICPMDDTYGTATYFFFAVMDMMRKELKFTNNSTNSHERFSIDTRLLHDMITSFSLKYPSIMVHYGDIITDLDYVELVNYWEAYRNKHTANLDSSVISSIKGMVAATSNIRHDYSSLEIDSGNRLVCGITEKPKLTMPSWTGIGIFDTKRIMTLLASRISWISIADSYTPTFLDFAYDILPNMAKNGELAAFLYDGEWFDIGNLNSYNKLAKQAMDNPVGMMNKLYGVDNVANNVLQRIKVPITGLVY